MRHFLVSALVLCSGCAFEDGRPWGRAVFDVSAVFAPAASQLDGELLKTAQDYRVRLDVVEVAFAAAELEVGTAGDAAGFDPANPPEGYGACHDGHCHDVDGSLVPYEDIEPAAAASDFVVTQQLGEEPVPLDADPREIALRDCSNDCMLDRGELRVARIRVHSVRLLGEVSDTRDRLAEPVALDLDAPVDVPAAVTVSGEIGPGQPGGLHAALAFALPPELLDDVDFATSPDVQVLVTSIHDAIEAHSVLGVTLETFTLAPDHDHDHE